MENVKFLPTNPAPGQQLLSENEFEIGAAYQFFPEDLYEMKQSTCARDWDAVPYKRSFPDPGFEFGIRNTDIHFWVECKYRENRDNQERLPIFNEGQLAKYKSMQHSFLFLCTNRSGKPANYFIPFNHISDNELNFSFIEPYRLSDGLGIRPGIVNKYLKLEYSVPVKK